jgi:hypothetical protein
VVDAKSDAPIARASLSLRPKGATDHRRRRHRRSRRLVPHSRTSPWVYSLRATFIGFAPLVQDVTIAPPSPITDVGIIKLSQVAVALSALAVTEERAAVTGRTRPQLVSRERHRARRRERQRATR